MSRIEDKTERPAGSGRAVLATGIAAAGAAALILLPKVRRALAGTLDLAEDTARRWVGAADEVADAVSRSGPAGRKDAEAETPPQDSAQKESAPKKAGPKRGTTKSTSPGHVNPRNQKVIRRVGKSPSWKGQYTYELECFECGHRYGANGPDIEGANGGEGRACPKCQGGKPGDPI